MLKNPYKTYIKDKFMVSSNYNTFETNYIKFSDYILLNLFGPVIISIYKNIKYLFILLDTITRWLNFYLLKIKIKSEALEAFKDIKITIEN